MSEVPAEMKSLARRCVVEGRRAEAVRPRHRLGDSPEHREAWSNWNRLRSQLAADCVDVAGFERSADLFARLMAEAEHQLGRGDVDGSHRAARA